MVSSNARFFRPSQKGPPGAAIVKFWYIIFQYARPILRPLLVRRGAFTGNHLDQKNDPGSRGHLATWNFERSLNRDRDPESLEDRSDDAAGNVAVADHGLRVSQQQTVDASRQAADQGGVGRCKRGVSSIGHQVPFHGAGDRPPLSESNLRMPDATNNEFVCIAAISLGQCS